MPAVPWLARAAAAHPDRPAVVTAEGAPTCADLARTAAAGAGALVARGVGKGDRVALALPPGRAFAEALHACLWLGAVVVPVDLRLAPAERERWSDGAAVVVSEALELAGRGPAPAPAGPDHPVVRTHTSGTSRGARPVTLTRSNWEASARGTAAALGVHPRERWLCVLPATHVGGLSILIRSAIHATTAVVHAGFDAAAVRRSLQEDGITLVSLVPTMLARLLDAGLQSPPALRCALVGGGPVPPALLNRAREAGIPVAQTYGLTEACSQVTVSAIGDPSTAGMPLPGTDVRIAADGEILVAGPTIAPGAAGDDGFLHTGDLGSLDGAGRLTITGRKSEIIVTGGENVAPAEVESVLAQHPAVADSAVFARPDAEWGERVSAAVVLRPGLSASPEELRAHCAGRLAGFQVPKDFDLVPELPRTPTGKVLRRALT